MGRITSKYAGSCACGSRFPAGTDVDWQRDRTPAVTGCPVCNYTGVVNGDAAATNTALGTPTREPLPENRDPAPGALAALFARLDEGQQRVSKWKPGPGRHLRVVAGAGSGKTTTMAAFVGERLLAGTPPAQIVCTTFTAKGGAEFKSRLLSVLPRHVVSAMRVGTFHSLCLRWLRQLSPTRWNDGFNVDGKAGERAPEVPATNQLWARALDTYPIHALGGEHGLSIIDEDAPATYPLAIDVIRSRGVRLADVKTARAACEATGLPLLFEAWTLVERQKAACKGWDFADALDAAYDALGDRQTVSAGRLVVVDEAQDNSLVQIAVAQRLAGPHGSLVLVGDVRQSIFAWRGAAPNLFLKADAAIPGIETLELSVNYRSLPGIVALGNAIAEGQSWSLGAASTAARTAEGAGLIREVDFPSSLDEAEAVAGEIAAAVRDGQRKAGDHAILCRTRAQQGFFEAALVEAQVPVAVVGAQGFFSSRGWQEFAAHLACASGVATPEQAKYAIRHPVRGMSHRFAEGVLGRLDGQRTLSWAVNAEAQVTRDRRAREAALAFLGDMVRFGSMPWAQRCTQLGEALAALHKGAGTGEDDSAGLVLTAAVIARRFEDMHVLNEFVGRCNGTIVPAGDADDGRVCISTIHKAKGREWPVVYLPATQGQFPTLRAEGDDARMAEERRLFYVAVTRARDQLVCTWADKTPRAGVGGASEFLDLLPPVGSVRPEPATVVIPDDVIADGEAEVHAAHDRELAAVEAKAEHGAPPRLSTSTLALALMAVHAETRKAPRKMGPAGERAVTVTADALWELLGMIPGWREVENARVDQRVWAYETSDGYIAYVYSSIPKDDVESRGVGEDSMRVVVCRRLHGGERSCGRNTLIMRTANWRRTLMERLAEALVKASGRTSVEA